MDSKNRIQADFLRELSDDFAIEGRRAIERMREEDPTAYIRVVASLITKDVTISSHPFAEFTDDELVQAIALLQRYVDDGAPSLAGRTIEGEAVPLRQVADARG